VEVEHWVKAKAACRARIQANLQAAEETTSSEMNREKLGLIENAQFYFLDVLPRVYN
jgi:hypothetical protein